jgi:uncharacterized protein YqjF (DUF2071 family)
MSPARIDSRLNPPIVDFSPSGTTHRPWTMPGMPWSIAMNWHDLGFLHWPIAAARLRPLIPNPLEIDTFDGKAWLGVVPFFMSGVRARCMPALPGIGAFAELNLRTYVTCGGKPGVWFFSLDAASRLAVRLARWSFHLPYFDARFDCRRDAREIEYRSIRVQRHAPPAAFHARYRPIGEPFDAAPGTIEHFLVERYCLYAADRRQRVYRGEIHHSPWPLQRADCDLMVNTIPSMLGIDLPSVPALVHFARFLAVRAWFRRAVEPDEMA